MEEFEIEKCYGHKLYQNIQKLKGLLSNQTLEHSYTDNIKNEKDLILSKPNLSDKNTKIITNLE